MANGLLDGRGLDGAGQGDLVRRKGELADAKQGGAKGQEVLSGGGTRPGGGPARHRGLGRSLGPAQEGLRFVLGLASRTSLGLWGSAHFGMPLSPFWIFCISHNETSWPLMF